MPSRFSPLTHRTLRTACLSLLFALILSNCATAAAPSLSEVKKFDAYRLYYAGAEAAGLPLDQIIGDPNRDGPRSSCCNFIYGTCTAGPSAEGSCAPPLEIQVFSTCRRWFSALSRNRRLYEFRGAKATGGGSGIEGGSPLEIFTDRTTVVIWAENRKTLTTAARQLRDVRAAKPQSHLPPPIPGSLWGKLPCQQKPG